MWFQIGRVKSSVVSKRQWVVLRRESGSRPSRIEIYRNEDQSVEPTRVISFGGNVSMLLSKLPHLTRG